MFLSKSLYPGGIAAISPMSRLRTWGTKPISIDPEWGRSGVITSFAPRFTSESAPIDFRRLALGRPALQLHFSRAGFSVANRQPIVVGSFDLQAPEYILRRFFVIGAKQTGHNSSRGTTSLRMASTSSLPIGLVTNARTQILMLPSLRLKLGIKLKAVKLESESERCRL